MRGLVIAVGLAACGRLGFDATRDGSTQDGAPDAAPTVGPWFQVLANSYFTCAIQEDGEAWCWGLNERDQLGIGGPRAYARDPGQLAGAWRTLALGRDSACGLQLDGSLWCWGSDDFAQIPDGVTLQDAPLPIRIGTDVDWVEIVVGLRHGCARKQDNTVWCWGDNGYTQYAPSIASSAVPVLTRSNVRSVSVGYLHTHMVDTDGTMHTIGFIQQGEGGTGLYAMQYMTYATVGSDSDWRDVTTGLTRTCATKTNGTMWCTGEGNGGAIGNGAFSSVPTLTKVTTGTTWGAMSLGLGHTCAMRSDGTGWCWGTTTRGEIGLQTAMQPEPLSLGDMRAIAAGDFHTCFVTTGGVLRCSGVNAAAQIRGPASTSLVPAEVGGTWAKIDSNNASTCAINAAAELACWGANDNNQIGTGDERWRNVPFQFGTTGWTDVAVGGAFSLGIRGGGLYWWGYDGANGVSSPTPTQLLGFTNFSQVTTGREHGCALRASGELYCWGFNSSGQVGNGNTTDQPAPVLIGTLFSHVAAGETHTCALENSAIKCWGKNVLGQIGNNTYVDVSTPTTVMCAGCGAKVVRNLTLGDNFSCVHMTDNSVSCWGTSFDGQFGNGNNTSSPVGVLAATAGGHSFTSIDAGDLHVCGVATTGAMYCWGHGDEGQIGEGMAKFTTTSPSQVGTALDWSSVTTGRHVSCGLKTSGARFCWGDSAPGVYGDGRAWIEDFVTISPEQ